MKVSLNTVEFTEEARAALEAQNDGAKQKLADVRGHLMASVEAHIGSLHADGLAMIKETEVPKLKAEMARIQARLAELGEGDEEDDIP